MKKTMIVIVASALLTGCPMPPEQAPSRHETVASAPISNYLDSQVEIRTVHDDKHGVTCWYMTGGYSDSSPALSCLPDNKIKDAQ